jgi:hypothetical protein
MKVLTDVRNGGKADTRGDGVGDRTHGWSRAQRVTSRQPGCENGEQKGPRSESATLAFLTGPFPPASLEVNAVDAHTELRQCAGEAVIVVIVDLHLEVEVL